MTSRKYDLKGDFAVVPQVSFPEANTSLTTVSKNGSVLPISPIFLCNAAKACFCLVFLILLEDYFQVSIHRNSSGLILHCMDSQGQY